MTKSSSKKRVTWKPRNFILSADSLRWYTHRSDGVSQPRGFLQLTTVTLSTKLDPKELRAQQVPKRAPLLCLKLESQGGLPPLYVHAADLEDKQQWVSALRVLLLRRILL